MQDVSTVTSDLTTAITSLKTALADYNVSNLTLIWVAGLAIAIGPAIAWFAFRFLKRVINKALFRGKL